MKLGPSLTRPKQGIINIDLQLNLFNTWIKYGVADYYQNIFLAYLDELGAETVEYEIKREIKQTIQKNTFFFIIENLQEERHGLIRSLQQMLIDKNCEIPQQEIEELCGQVSKLRQINLQIAQNLLKMYEKFKCCNYQSLHKQNSFYEVLFDDLDKQNYFIKKSFLNQFIKFDQGYDPFLMDPYEKFHRSIENQEKQSIKSLFNLNISFVYRLMKAKNTILEIRSKFKEIQPQEVSKVTKRSRGFRFSQQKHIESPRIAPQNSQYRELQPITAAMPFKKQIKSAQAQPIKITPFKVFPSGQKSRTTVHPITEERSKSPTFSDKYNQLMFSKVNRSNSIDYEQSKKNQRVHNQFYFQTDPSEERLSSNVYKMSPFNEARQKKYALNEQSTNNYTMKHRLPRLDPIKVEKNNEDSIRQSRIVKNNSARPKEVYSEPKKSIKLGIIKQYEIKQELKLLPEPEPSKPEPPKVQPSKAQSSKVHKQEISLPYHPQREMIKQPEKLDEESYEIRHYNPITKNQFQKVKKQKRSIKYDLDFNRPQNDSYIIQEYEERKGLQLEMPICKFNSKKKIYPKRYSAPQQISATEGSTKREIKNSATPERKIQKTVAYIEKVEQECQTVEVPSKPQPITPITKQYQKSLQKDDFSSKGEDTAEFLEQQRPRKRSQAPSYPRPEQIYQNKQPNRQEQTSKVQKNQKNSKYPIKQAAEDVLDQTLENELIIDDRPEPSSPENTRPRIRTIPKQQSPLVQAKVNEAPDSPIRINQTSKISSQKDSSSQKKEIKMKIGKATITEIVSMLQTSNIKPEDKTLFGLERLIETIKMNQTYLAEFHVNHRCAIIALCTYVPGIGMAIKLWAAIQSTIEQNISNNLFLKYIQFIEKSTTVEKIMFSGNGDAFKELKAAEFTKKKQNLFERIRKIPSKQSELEFKPFLYIQCSTVNFNQPAGDAILFSEEIQQFTESNSHASSFVAQIDKNTIPTSVQPLIKVDDNLKDFNEVNKILAAQQFDCYQAGSIKVNSINLLRFYLNTHFKGPFIASDGYLQFVGTLLYEKNDQKVICLPTAKNNGFLYFAKSMSIISMMQRCKVSSNNKTKFCVKMFHKVLYGRIPNKSKGCYGNWEINLTWEDEMQGKIKHNLPQGIVFGPETFCVGIEVEKEMLLCAQIKKQDFIY